MDDLSVKQTSRAPTTEGPSSSHRARTAPKRTGIASLAARSNRAAVALAAREHEADRLGRDVLARAQNSDPRAESHQRPEPGGKMRSRGEVLPPALDAALAHDGVAHGSVTVHRDAAAHIAARKQRALAYVRGADVVFGREAAAPESRAGRDLLAHELGHVVQQQREGRPRIDRAPSGEPRARLDTGALAVIFKGALEDAVRGPDAFWKLLEGNRLVVDEMDHVCSDVDDDDFDRLSEALTKGINDLELITAYIELADDGDPASDDYVDVTYDGAARILTEQLGSSDLDGTGLPTSFGTNLFFDYAADHLATYASGLAAALLEAYDGFDPDTAQVSLDATLALAATDYFGVAVTTLTNSLQYAVETWGDPFGLLELELEGAIEALRTARGDFASAADEETRAATGKRIGRLARLILVIDHHLVPLEQRQMRRMSGDRVEELGDTDNDDRVRAVVDTARAYAPDEAETLLYQGDDLSRLADKTVELSDEHMLYADPSSTDVTNEEAYPHYTDEATMSALTTLAAQVEAEAADLETLHAAVVPERVTSFDEFQTVYDRWYGFWSRQSRDNDPAYQWMDQVYRLVMPLAGMGSASGWIGRGFLTQSVGEYIPHGFTEPDAFGVETSRIPFKRRERSEGSIVGADGRSGVDYSTAQLPVGSRASLDVSGEISTRDEARQSKQEDARGVFDYIYQPGADQIGLAYMFDRYGGLDPGPTRFWDQKDKDDDRWGYSEGWNYLLRTTIISSSGDMLDVYEHKTMRSEVAAYLVAATQYQGSVGSPHFLKDDKGKKVGDRVARVSGLERAEVTASARYLKGERDDTRNPAADRLTSQIASAKARIEKHSPSALVAALERSMDEFFAQADPSLRVLSVMYIASEEHNLEDALLEAFDPAAIAWAVGISGAIAAMLWGLSMLGTWGKLAEVALQKTLQKIGVSTDVAAFITLGQWALNAGTVGSFGDAAGWAYVSRDVAKELGEVFRDYGLAKARVGLGAFKQLVFPKEMPDNARDLGKMIAPILADKTTGRELSWNLEDGVRKALDAGEGDIMTKDAIDFLKAADPDAYQRLKTDYPHVFKDALTGTPSGLKAGTPAATMHGLVAVGVPAGVAGRVRVVEVSGDSVRIRAEKGVLVVEVGKSIPNTPAGRAVLEGHLGSIRRLAKYTGAIGNIRYWLAKVGAALRFVTIHTRGGEAEEELKKLREIKQKLEGLRDHHEGALATKAKDADSVDDADIDLEIANIQKQIDLYTADLGSTAAAKGFIAAEGRGNFAELDAQGIMGAKLSDPGVRDKLTALGYRIDVNDVIYRPRGAGDTMEPLTTRADGTIDLSGHESASAVQARLRDELPQNTRTKFDAEVAAAPKSTKLRLVEGIHDTKVKWSDILTGAKQRELKGILVTGGVDPKRAQELIDGLLARGDTLKVVFGTDPVRSAMDYRKGYAKPGDPTEVHHFDPLYLGGGHDLLVAVPSGAHDDLHKFFDDLEIPSGALAGTRLQPQALQAAVKGATRPAVVFIDTDTGIVTYKLVDEL